MDKSAVPWTHQQSHGHVSSHMDTSAVPRTSQQSLWKRQESLGHVSSPMDTSAAVPWTCQESHGRHAFPWTRQQSHGHVSSPMDMSAVRWTRQQSHGHVSSPMDTPAVPWTWLTCSTLCTGQTVTSRSFHAFHCAANHSATSNSTMSHLRFYHRNWATAENRINTHDFCTTFSSFT